MAAAHTSTFVLEVLFVEQDYLPHSEINHSTPSYTRSAYPAGARPSRGRCCCVSACARGLLRTLARVVSCRYPYPTDAYCSLRKFVRITLCLSVRNVDKKSHCNILYTYWMPKCYSTPTTTDYHRNTPSRERYRYGARFDHGFVYPTWSTAGSCRYDFTPSVTEILCSRLQDALLYHVILCSRNVIYYLENVDRMFSDIVSEIGFETKTHILLIVATHAHNTSMTRTHHSDIEELGHSSSSSPFRQPIHISTLSKLP